MNEVGFRSNELSFSANRMKLGALAQGTSGVSYFLQFHRFRCVFSVSIDCDAFNGFMDFEIFRISGLEIPSD